MDTRRSYYLASRQDDFDFPSRDGDWVADIPYIMPANDNKRTKDRLLSRCGALLRRLIARAASDDRPVTLILSRLLSLD